MIPLLPTVYRVFSQGQLSEPRFRDMYDVCIVGGGPAGLSSAIRIAQLAQQNEKELRICLIEKAGEIGGHTLSGAVIDPEPLKYLFPDLSEIEPLKTQVNEDQVYFLTENKHISIPFAGSSISPLYNHGNFIISLGNLCRWLGEQAENLGVEIYSGIAGSEVLYDKNGAVQGIATADSGIGKSGLPKPTFERGMELAARTTLFAEGCRGSLSKTVIKKFHLDTGKQPQTYGIGFKELWSIDPKLHHQGRVIHSVGYPFDTSLYGGGFLYHLEDNQVSVGLAVGLDYENPTFSPYEEFQKLKQHELFKGILQGGECLSYGARTIVEGGIQSLPHLTFPGGALIGDAAGFLNVSRLKGTHAAISTGTLAGESVFESFFPSLGSQTVKGPSTTQDIEPLDPEGEISPTPVSFHQYQDAFESSPIYDELYKQRNVRPAAAKFKNLFAFLGYTAFDLVLLQGKVPWTLNYPSHGDHGATKPLKDVNPIKYSKPDGVFGFDRLTSVSRTGTFHEEDQPSHLKLSDESIPVDTNLNTFGGPEQFYCPAGVYEFVPDATSDRKRLQINHANCIHCKACDIKDPTQNITWTVPEGGQGPGYPNM